MLYESSYYGVVQMDDIIEHHGIKGMKWGIRRYQNPDGTLTSAGKSRYLKKAAKGKLSVNDLPDSERKRNWLKTEEDFDAAVKAYHDSENEYYSDEKTVIKYATKSAEANWDWAKKNGWNDSQHDEWVRNYTHGDFDQGNKTGHDYWLEDNHPDIVKNMRETSLRSIAAKKEYAKEIFGDDSPRSTNYLLGIKGTALRNRKKRR